VPPALAAVLAPLVFVVHLAFVLFVVLGAVAAIKWPRLLWVQVPCVVWGAALELGGWICPLTPLENYLRLEAGQDTYAGGFIDHYLAPALYPEWLDRPTQWIIGVLVITWNAAIYLVLWRRSR